jgi:hypothetical protein
VIARQVVRPCSSWSGTSRAGDAGDGGGVEAEADWSEADADACADQLEE